MAVVVITGASSGIGEAAARALAARSHKLVLAARRVDRLEALEKELSAHTEVVTVQTDVARPEDLEELARRAAERFGGIDVWINNAGVGHRLPWWDKDAEGVRHVVDVNLTGPILAVRAALPYMLPKRRGHFINVASVAGHVGTTGVYSATKFGLRGFTEALRRELLPHGIRVSLLTPGFIRTEMTRNNPFPMPSAEVAGRVIVHLVERPRREVVVPGWYRLVISFNRWFPGVTDWVTSRYFRAEGGVGQARRARLR
ncbi:MAG: SDR family NAD(P)-dependent oxidoreductase [Bacillota bacterium]